MSNTNFFEFKESQDFNEPFDSNAPSVGGNFPSFISPLEESQTPSGGTTAKPTIVQAYFAKKNGSAVSYTRINAGKLEETLYIVIEGKNVKGKKVSVNILDRYNTISTNTNKKSKAVSVLSGKEDKMKLTATFDHFDSSDNHDFAVIKFQLRPKEDTKLKEWYEKMKKRKDKSVQLYLLVDIHAVGNEGVTADNVVYQGKNSGEDSSKVNYWLDANELYFKVKYCNCGVDLILKFSSTRFGTAYGPVYWGKIPLESYANWTKLIADKVVTQEEKEIFVGMSPNEGRLDAVQSYDSEIATAGAMQKTISPTGKGELPKQVARFKKDYPKKYKSLFEKCGWTVESNTMYYKNPYDRNSKKITGAPLKKLIREGFTKEKFEKKIKSRNAPLEALAHAVADEDYQKLQIKDFVDRLNKKVLPAKPTGYSYTMKSYLKSKLGRATALDHHINRPSNMVGDFGAALDRFFEKNKTVKKDPSKWGTNHATYEKTILDDYGKKRSGTDMANRYTKLDSRL